MVDNISYKDNHALIIGGGIFGLSTAIILGENGYNVTLVEKEKDIMTKASLVNQNRIHMGYHYPRSISTGKESLIGIENFKKYYPESFNEDFKKYYGIAKHGSKVSAEEFFEFCMELKLPLKEEYPEDPLIDRSKLQACWITPEPIFDFNALKTLIIKKIIKIPNITLMRNTQVIDVKIKDGIKQAKILNGDIIHANYLINATYSKIPEVAKFFDQEKIYGKYELCIMPILKIKNTKFKNFGITIMDGPFCSIMPRGFNQSEFILYHVEKSVIQNQVGTKLIQWDPIRGFPELICIDTCSNYFPVIKEMELIDTWITSRIVLPNKERDDARPTLLIDHSNNIYSIFSGKVATAIDAGFQILNAIKNN